MRYFVAPIYKLAVTLKKKMTVKTKITKEITENLSEEQLDELVYNKASDKYFGTFGENFENTEKDKILCQMFACSVLDFEVCNGGFDQFFSNSDDLSEFALDGLLKINEIEHYELLNLAIKIYNEQKEAFKDIRNTNLDELDERFYELNKIDKSRQKFIIENSEIFYD
jgi:hypothetical protein